MDFDTLTRRMADEFTRLSPQLRQAARYTLDRPEDVALMSMRTVATQAGVQPSTMVRLARSLGFTSYTAFREPFETRLRRRPNGLLARARDLQARGAEGRATGLLQEVLSTDIANLRDTFANNDVARFEACAAVLSRGRRVFILGVRSCYPVAFFFHYAYGMFRDNGILLDGRGGTFADELRGFSRDDVMMVISVEPYSDKTVRSMEYCHKRGGTAVAVTDSVVSPVAANADHVLVVSNHSPSFFDSIAAAMAAVEALIVLMVAAGGDNALATIEESERHLDDFRAYWQPDGKKS